MKCFAWSVFGLCFAGIALLSGCIPGKLIDSEHGQSAGQIIDSGQNQPDAAAFAPGSYWALETDTGLDLFQMPAFRGDTGKWQTLAAVPDWFTQQGLYTHDAAGNWTLETTGDEADLDSLLQTWDPAPQAG